MTSWRPRTPGPEDLPPLLRRLLGRALPADRRHEILHDLADVHARRQRRLGPFRAAALLWRDAASLLLWRLGPRARRAGRDGAPSMPDGTTTMTTMGRDFLQDLRFGARTLLRRPGFTATAVLILALGIGAPTTVFTLVDGIFFWRPAHVEAPDELVRLYRAWAPGEGGGSLQTPDFRYYRANASSVEGVGAWGGSETVTWSTDGRPGDQLDVGFASHEWFDVLGVPMAAGRDFLPEEDATPGTHPVVVLSHGFWRGALGADPDVVGRTLTLGDRPYTVVGVAPEGFRGLSPVEEAPDAWAPIAMFGTLSSASGTAWWERLPTRRTSWLQVVARRGDGVTFEATRDEMEALASALTYEGKPEGEGILVERSFLYRPSQQATLDTLARILLVAVGFVLAVAAANVAVLLLARATARTREMGVRTALGAGRGRLGRQLLAETLLLALAGGALGVGLAWALSGLAGALLPLPFTTEFRPRTPVLGAAVGLSFLTAVGIGLLPALQASRTDVRSALRGGGGRGGTERGGARGALVVGQVALSVVLVSGALLFGRSFWTAQTQDLGFERENRLLVQVDLQTLGYDAEEGPLWVDRALERLRGMPGVVRAATTVQVPFQGDWTTEFDAPPGATPNSEDGRVFTGLNVVTEGYFETMGVPVVRGRSFGPADGAGATPVVVVNETLARQVWPGQDPVGRTLPLGDDRSFTVVGVAADATYYRLGEDPHPQTWAPLAQAYQPLVNFVVHTRGPAAEMADPVRGALRQLDPRLAVGWTSSLGAVFEDQVARYRATAVLVSLFGAVALLLAATGLYGVVRFRVARRTREIGLRMALGAARGRLAASVVGSGVRLAAAGTLLGLAGAILLRGYTASLLFGVEPTDPLPLVGAALCLLGVSVLAATGPARRATRVDPMEAMRSE